jgi:hypothetical protein
MTQTNTIQTAPEALPTRADRRRAAKAEQKRADYAKSGFVDRAAYHPLAFWKQRPGKDRFTPEQIDARAQARANHRIRFFEVASHHISQNELLRLMDTRAPHANRSTPDRKHLDRSASDKRARDLYLAGLARPQPIHHMHSVARRRAWAAQFNQEAPLALAA